LLNAIIDIIYNGISFIDVLVIVFRELIAFITGGILFIIGMLILTSLEE
jgi:cbb3-type cytochrome oxidase subunit 1